MLWLPTVRPFVLQIAVRELPVPLSTTAEQPAIALPPSVTATVPVGFTALTIAVKVTLAPTTAGFGEASRLVVVAALPPAARTAAPASTIPAPQSAIVQSRAVPVGNGRAVL